MAPNPADVPAAAALAFARNGGDLWVFAERLRDKFPVARSLEFLGNCHW